MDRKNRGTDMALPAVGGRGKGDAEVILCLVLAFISVCATVNRDGDMANANRECQNGMHGAIVLGSRGKRPMDFMLIFTDLFFTCCQVLVADSSVLCYALQCD